MTRRELREQIFKLLFGVEFHDRQELPEQIAVYEETEEPWDAKDGAYISGKCEDIVAHLAEIDEAIDAVAEGWKTGRMGKVDLTLIRLAVYEMKYDEDVPVGVAINEAVELAKDFGGEDESHRFVNGILGRIAKMLEGEEDEGAESEGDPEVPADGDAASDGLSPDAADTACDQVEPLAAQDDKSPEGELSHGA